MARPDEKDLDPKPGQDVDDATILASNASQPGAVQRRGNQDGGTQEQSIGQGREGNHEPEPTDYDNDQDD